MLTMDNHRKVLLDLFSILTIILLCSVRLSNCKMPAIFVMSLDIGGMQLHWRVMTGANYYMKIHIMG